MVLHELVYSAALAHSSQDVIKYCHLSMSFRTLYQELQNPGALLVSDTYLSQTKVHTLIEHLKGDLVLLVSMLLMLRNQGRAVEKPRLFSDIEYLYIQELHTPYVDDETVATIVHATDSSRSCVLILLLSLHFEGIVSYCQSS